MEKAILLLAAIVLVILGARGTYKAVWNQFFPNEQIVTTPVSTVGVLSAASAPSLTNTTGSQPGQTATNPVQVGQQAGANTRSAISQLLGNGGGSNTAHTVAAPGGVYPVRSIGTTKQAVISAGNGPSWWPSWLPLPAFLRSGQGQTGQVVNNPWAP